MSISDLMQQDLAAAGITPDNRSLAEKMQSDLASHNTPEVAPESWLDTVKGGIASAPINAYLGIKQMFPGGLDDLEKSALQQNKEAASKAPVSSVLSNLAMLAPTAFIPGANTLTGASTIGAVTGLINPADSFKERALNTGIGGVSGLAGQAIGNKLANALQSKLGNSVVDAETTNALNAPRKATLEAGQDAGYVMPPSAVNPTFIGNRLESLAGKAALKQESTLRNQGVTNDLARQSLNLADNVPLSVNTLEDIRKDAGKAYQAVSELSPIAKQDNEALKQARNDAQGWYNAYNRSASPADLAKAKEADVLKNDLEQSLENEAEAAGRPELIPQLRDARQTIAKTYTVQRALNDATGDIDAKVLGRLVAKQKPLSPELETAGRFNNAFPQFTGNAASTPAAGVGKTEMLAAALLGAGGAHETDSPYGAGLGALAFLSSPARSMLLSKALQGMMTKVPEAAAPTSIKLMENLINNRITKGALPALTAQGILSSPSVLQ